MRRVAGAAVIALAGLALSPALVALADDGQYVSPSTPTMRGAERGSAVAGRSEVRGVTRLSDANNIYVGIQGGDTSAGVPIVIKDGNMGEMPVITGEAGVICSSGQHFSSAMIPCFAPGGIG